MLKKFETDAMKNSSKRVIQKTEAKATGDLIGNKIANRITKFQNNTETVTNKDDKEIPKRNICISSRKTRSY